jgi:hypothetical protein
MVVSLSSWRKSFCCLSSDDYNFFVRIIKENGPPKELPVTPKVTSVISDQQPKEFINSLTELYGGKNPDQSIIAQLNSKSKDRKALAIQKFRSVVNEVVKKEFKDEELSEFVQNLKFKVVEDMLNVRRIQFECTVLTSAFRHRSNQSTKLYR